MNERKPRHYHDLRKAIHTSGQSYDKTPEGFFVASYHGDVDIKVESGRVTLEGTDAVRFLAALFWGRI